MKRDNYPSVQQTHITGNNYSSSTQWLVTHTHQIARLLQTIVDLTMKFWIPNAVALFF